MQTSYKRPEEQAQSLGVDESSRIRGKPINCRRLTNILAVVLVAGFFLTSCGEEEKSNRETSLKTNIDYALYEISPFAALIHSGIKTNKQGNCTDQPEKLDSILQLKQNADVIKQNADVSQLFTEKMNSYANLCSLFVEVEKATDPVFQKIKQERKFSKELYVFSIFEETDGNYLFDTLFLESEIGLFDSLASCDVLEKFAREKNIPVQQCRKWKDIKPKVRK